jgi:hypothetical protein
LADDHAPAKSDYEAIIDQLNEIVKNGHEIHLHIHPHWSDAVYIPEMNQWSLQEKRFYTFASLSETQQAALFDASMDIMRSVLHTAHSNQPIDMYRAGGWSIQPFDNFKPYFQKYGIMHELSVIPGMYLYSDAHHFDFRNAPVDNPVYRFSKDVCIPDAEGTFTEWTISTLSLSKNQQWFDFKISGLLHRLHITGSRKGYTVAANITSEGDIYSGQDKIKRHIASFEGLNPYRVMKYLNLIRESDYFHFISHPKLINDFELKMIRRLFRLLNKNFVVETDFRKKMTA